MILLDALYVNDGGAKILLDYLVQEIERDKLNVFYLFDERCKNSYLDISEERKIYLKPSLLGRYKFYITNRNKFLNVLCFGNLPPNIRLNAVVFTYFHQAMYLAIPKEFSVFERMVFKLKIVILKYITKNSDFWLVQTDLIKDRLQQNFNLASENVMVLPFYPDFSPLNVEIFREENTYFYVSNASPHKNHKRLINVFCSFFDTHKKGELIVTVSDSYPEVVQLINEKVQKGYPIVNIGFVNRLTLQSRYLASEFLIFPSLAESFGLGLIEAIECGCKVIGADLPYTYEVCDPTIVFNASDENSIFDALANSLNKDNLKSSVPKIKNSINHILGLLVTK